MEPMVKQLWSPDLPQGSPQLPSTPEHCYIVIQADIGLSDSDAADTFTFGVTTPAFLAAKGHQLSRHEILLPQFDWQSVELAIQQRCKTATGSTWEELTKSIGGQWEFDGYDDSNS